MMNDTAGLLLQLEEVEAERDALVLRLAIAEDDAAAERVPIELARRLMAGDMPVRVWRHHRGLSLRALASAADISPSMLSEIETGKKDGSLWTLAALARALRIDIDDLLPW